MAMEQRDGTATWSEEAGRTAGNWPRSGYVWLGLGALAASLPLLFGRRRRVSGRRVGDVMIRDVVTIDASSTIRDAADRMRESNVGVLPVIEWGQVRGVVTDRDLVVRGLARGVDPSTTRIADCMTTSVMCARPDWDVDRARRLMADNQVGRLPVVDERDRLLGIVTLGSLALRSSADEETLDTAREVSRRSARA